MTGWERELGGTWLADRKLLRSLDQHVRDVLGDDAITSVQILVRDALNYGRGKQWYWASIAICLLAELLLQAPTGEGRLMHAVKQLRAAGATSLAVDVTTLELVRNALLHPAAVGGGTGKGQSCVQQLAVHLAAMGETFLASRLRSTPTMIGSEDVARTCLRILEEVGKHVLSGLE